MLGLAEQVRGDGLRVRRGVGDDGDLGEPGEQVNGDRPSRPNATVAGA
ncbi:hypothetical protein AB0G32_12875 [Streptomyces sp. NPDC023723]